MKNGQRLAERHGLAALVRFQSRTLRTLFLFFSKALHVWDMLYVLSILPPYHFYRSIKFNTINFSIIAFKFQHKYIYYMYILKKTLQMIPSEMAHKVKSKVLESMAKAKVWCMHDTVLRLHILQLLMRTDHWLIECLLSMRCDSVPNIVNCKDCS